MYLETGELEWVILTVLFYINSRQERFKVITDTH